MLDMQGKRLFLYFEGVNSVADVFVNHRSVGSHKGGYTAFCIEITHSVKPGGNLLEVYAGNAFRTDVLPISGDFNVYGGIHRPVHLVVTGSHCITPMFYGSCGVLVKQRHVSVSKAQVDVETHLSLATQTSGLMLRTAFVDAEGREVASGEAIVSDSIVSIPLTISKPHLWQGRHNPYIYKVKSELYHNNRLVDSVCTHTGLRSFSVDPERGFMLNGAPYSLYGFNRHDDFKAMAVPSPAVIISRIWT